MTVQGAGAHAILTFTVSDDDTARALGSGSVPVLGTPRLLAWLEAATVAAVDGQLPEGATTVGTRLEIEHVAPAAVGAQVRCAAYVVKWVTRSLRYAVTATDAHGTTLAQGTIKRVVVDEQSFVRRVPAP